MIGYSLRRLLAAVPLLWLVWTLTFLVGRLAPGDPVALYEGPNVSPEALERLRQVYGLDDPLALQYLKQLVATATGDLALSTSQGRPVGDVIGEAIGPTLILTGLALILTFLFGGLIGVISATTARRPPDHILTFATLLLYSMPAFWLGVELVLLFSYQLGWLPASHMSSVNRPGGLLGTARDMAGHLLLPVATLSLGGAAVVSRHLRSSLLEALSTPFVNSARARGLSEWRVVGRHALRNALLPMVTLFGLSLPVLLSGAVVVEVIFSWPGLGQVAYGAIRARDYPLVQAATLMTAALVIVGSLLADVLIAALDPRVRLNADRR